MSFRPERSGAESISLAGAHIPSVLERRPCVRLTDDLTTFHSAASMAGHVQIAGRMTEKQQRRLEMKMVPAMSRAFELVVLLMDEDI